MRISLSKFTTSLVLVVAAVPSLAQAPDTKALKSEQIAKMKAFDWLDGEWRGEAVIKSPQGEIRLIQTERIGPFLDGGARVIEGRGYLPDGSVGFNALAVMVYDPATAKYAMHAFSDGRTGVFKLLPSEKGYIWETPAGPATIRYTASFRDGKWLEIGEFIMPGAPPRAFFEMTLKRVGDTDWPRGAPVGPK
jgi:hypothetical protein